MAQLLNNEVFLLILIILSILIPLLIKVISFFHAFHQKQCSIQSKIRNSQDEQEAGHWQRVRIYQTLCLIPFVNQTNVPRLYQFLHQFRRKAQSNRPDPVFSLLMPSIMGIGACMICLIGLTWAWFTDTTANTTTRIQAATYTVTASVTEFDTNIAIPQNVDGSYSLNADTEYSVILIIGGTATSNGYCVVTLPDNSEHVTIPMKQGESIAFHVISDRNGTISILGQWGTYSGIPDISQNQTLGGFVSVSPDSNESPDPEGVSSIEPEGASSAEPEGASSAEPEGASSTESEGASPPESEGASPPGPEGASSAEPEGASSTEPEGASSLEP